MSLESTVGVLGMTLAPELDEKLAALLRAVEAALLDSVATADKLVNETASHLVKAGGKRFRPLVTVLAAQFGDPGAPGVVPAAVVVELTHELDPLADERYDALVELAKTRRLRVVATTAAHYHAPPRRPLATALAAVRARSSLDDIDGWLPAWAGQHLRSGDEMAERFARWPGVVSAAADQASIGGGAVQAQAQGFEVLANRVFGGKACTAADAR